ncbi:HDL375Cp [Eremothecium sinecaudum]|uniref:HDL375Cp n=1 Tax=Eremothecium sinecaudum TaxID=45286 RepID=A0A0X8HRX4_9SACH|nr:HDL375Cp [Eremothecium sinecaudum]AMD20369.1 HDL375Cp [Eremothecium sinecaudum]
MFAVPDEECQEEMYPLMSRSDEARWQHEMRKQLGNKNVLQRPGIVLLCVLIGLYMTTQALVITPSIELQLDKICSGIAEPHNSMNCDKQIVQKSASNIRMAIMVIRGVVGTYMAGTLGKISDRIGRRPIFIYIAVTELIQILFLYIFYFTPYLPFTTVYMILVHTISALSGDTIALLSTTNSYISDIVEPEERTAWFSMTMSIVYTAVGVGPLVSALMVGASSTKIVIPFYCSIVAATLFVGCCIQMAESRHEEAMSKSNEDQRVASSTGSTNLLHFLAPAKLLWLPATLKGSLRPRYTVITLLVLQAMFRTTCIDIMPTVSLYATYVFNWGSQKLGYYISVYGISRAVFLGLLSPILLRFLQSRKPPNPSAIDEGDVITIRSSLAFATLSLAVVILVYNEVALYLYVFIQAFCGLIIPTIHAASLKYAPAGKAGEFLGAIALIDGICGLVFGPVFLSIYKLTVSSNPQFFLYISMIIGTAALATSYLLKP